jgi:segregation and condensation protein A
MSQQPEPKPSHEPEAEAPSGPATATPVGSLGGDSSSEGSAPEGSALEGPAPDGSRPSSRPLSRSENLARRASTKPVAGPEPVAAQPYQVVLPAFEGPLDLLLHLIQQHELDIRDIPIAFISEKYVEYILLMQGLNIDLASEYLVMAATLAHIKSKMLLPTPPQDQEEEAESDVDPRAELVRRLLEYQKYRHAAEELGNAPVLGRDVFTRGAPAPSVDGPAPLAQVSVFKLLDAFQSVLKRVKQTAEHHIDVDRISISERINQLTDLLRGKPRVRFEELFEEAMTRSDLVVTFLALLEMTRLRMTRIYQDGPLDPIYVELSLTEDEDTSVEPTDVD